MSINSVTGFAAAAGFKQLSQLRIPGAQPALNVKNATPTPPQNETSSLRNLAGQLQDLKTMAAKSEDGNLPAGARAAFQEFVNTFNAMEDGAPGKNRAAQAARGFLQDIRDNMASGNGGVNPPQDGVKDRSSLRGLAGQLQNLEAMAAKSEGGNLPPGARAAFQEFVKSFNALEDGAYGKNRAAQAARGFLQDIRNNTADAPNSGAPVEVASSAAEASAVETPQDASSSLRAAGASGARVVDLTA